MNNPDQVAWLVVGHGTRNAQGVDQLLSLTEHMRKLEPNTIIEPGFLELATPTIEDAVAAIASQGIHKILVVPILLFQAGHAKEDIPNAVETSARPCGIEIIGQSQPLETTDAAIRLSSMRFLEITQQALIDGCPDRAGHCANVVCSKGGCALIGKPLGSIGLAMVGRGTSDPSAIDAMLRFTQLRAARLPCDWVETGFFAGGNTRVDELLQSAASSSCDTIIVQPHLLFEGELINQLRTKTLAMQSSFPEKNWLITRTLGADESLAMAFVELARQARQICHLS